MDSEINYERLNTKSALPTYNNFRDQNIEIQELSGTCPICKSPLIPKGRCDDFCTECNIMVKKGSCAL